jgi:tetratricopeptide (TPR) repeat protein
VAAEQAYAVQPFVPEEGVGFFFARARARDPAFVGDGAVAEICRRLDNLPLALELAAARVRVLTPEQILRRLEQRLALLTGGARDAPERQQTLRATIAWSHDLLEREEQLLFARLAVFAGGWTIEAAEDVCGAELDLVQSLLDKSLLRLGDGRFTMLETIREFAQERLEASGEADALSRRHAEHFLAVGESANLSAESVGRERPELVRQEQDDFRRAIDWATEHDLELAFRLAISLEQFWAMNEPFEGVHRFAVLLERGDRVAPVLRARALRTAGESSFTSGDFEGALPLMEQSLEAFRGLGDQRAVAVLLQRIGVNALVANDLQRARELFSESLALNRANPNPKLEADLLHKLGWVERGEGNPERALELFRRSVVLLEDVGFGWMQASALLDSADVAHELGETAAAEDQAREALRLAHDLGVRHLILYSLALLARFALAAGRPERAGRLWGGIEADEARGPIGAWQHDREEFAAAILPFADAEFEAACSAGRRLTLDEGVACALAP